MDNIDNIMQLCRLCLVKDQVNVPIFGGTNDIEEISSKISSCLPVKVSPDDSLPKKICDDCSYKLDLLYVFRNTSINSEKQLYQWLEQAGISKTTSGTISTTQSLTTPILATDSTIPSVPISTLETVINDTITKSEISVKQEKTESTAGSELSAETQEYLLQQQKLPYQENFGDFNTTGTNSATAETEEPARKKPRRAAASKPPIKDNESDPDVPPTKAEDDSDEDIDDAGDGGGMDDDDDEEEEEDDGLDHPEFVDVPSTSAEEQPGPSGVNKDPIAAPCREEMDKAYRCPKCARTFKKLASLEDHMGYVHGNNWIYKCQVCSKPLKNIERLEKHLLTHKNQSLKCEICQLTLSSKHALINHKRRHMKDYQFHCGTCDKHFISRREYNNHVKSTHDKTTLCNICGKFFANQTNLRGHLKRHAENYNERNYKCKFCSKSFMQEFHLNKHIKRMHNENRIKYICDLCGKEILSLNSFKEHKKLHTGVRSFECDKCNKTFMKKSTLRIHMRTHTGERPHICNTCGKTFTQRSTLKTHLRTHTGEKPYKCNICNNQFISKNALNYHLKKDHQKL